MANSLNPLTTFSPQANSQSLQGKALAQLSKNENSDRSRETDFARRLSEQRGPADLDAGLRAAAGLGAKPGKFAALAQGEINQAQITALGGQIETLQQEGSPSPELVKSLREFEGQFLSTFLAEAFSNSEPDAPFHGGAGEEQFKSFLTDEYSQAFAARGGIGLADGILTNLTRLQELSS